MFSESSQIQTGYLFAESAGGGGGLLSMLLMFGAMFVILYFVLIRPQQKQQKKHQELLSSLKKGDEVILSSGIVGKIASVEDKFVYLEINDKTKLKVLRQAVSALAQPQALPTNPTGQTKE